MQETIPIHEHESSEDTTPRPNRRTVIAVLVLLLILLLLVFIPPYITLNRFQRRIAANIGASLGRPVHFDSATLNLLPLPGFTLERFVVDEDPAFGFEPILRADEVRANLRLRSLWNRRIELSRISLTEPSVNLVRTANGQWNLQSILLHTSSIQAAPTGQRYAGPAPRFPYIEATGARINLKLDQEKTPFSLNDADFALSLPEPRQWRFRLEAHPARSDTAPADAGTLRLEGTLGSAATPANAPAKAIADIPISIQGNWQDAQLGGLSRLLLGRDAGLRGELALTLNLAGTISRSLIASDIKIVGGRRADFVPPHPLFLEAACQAVASDTFHAFSAIECHWPPADSSDPSILILAAAVPDTRRPSLSSADLTLPALPTATLLDWLRIATPHPPTGLLGTGTLAGTLAWHPTPIPSPNFPLPKTVISTEAPERAAGESKGAQRRNPQLLQPQPTWSGELELSGESIQLPSLSTKINTAPIPIPLGDLLLRSTPPPATPQLAAPQPEASSFELLPILLPLGGRQPATLEGHFDAHGYTLYLTGTAIPARLLALGDAIPQLGDGLRQLLEPAPKPSVSTAASPPPTVKSATLSEPIRIDLTATRTWGGPQTWSQTTPPPPHTHRRSTSPQP